MTKSFFIVLTSAVLGATRAFVVAPPPLLSRSTALPLSREHWNIFHRHHYHPCSAAAQMRRRQQVRSTTAVAAAVDIDSLMDMDVVIFSPKESEERLVGAVQEDGKVAPLSAWSLDPAFGDSIELLVDEEDRPGFLVQDDQITVHSIIPEESLSYGSRQVGGGKGPINPHGEHSELLYYVDQELLNDIDVKINPDLEILW